MYSLLLLLISVSPSWAWTHSSFHPHSSSHPSSVRSSRVKMTAGIPPPGLQRRQAVMQGAAALLFSGGLGVAGEAAADESEEVDVYFGVGCFWHVQVCCYSVLIGCCPSPHLTISLPSPSPSPHHLLQHEFVEAEKRVLGRSDEQLTSLAGYAGGRRVGEPRTPTPPARCTTTTIPAPGMCSGCCCR
jgi:hypothetical protein